MDDKNDVYPLLISKDVSDKQIDLLYYEEHYCWIKSLSRLLSKQHSNKHGQRFICRYCLHFYGSTELLEKHQPDCFSINGVQKATLPQGEKSTVTIREPKRN